MTKNPNAWYGFRRDVKDSRDHMFAPSGAPTPASIDLVPHCPPVMDQKALGSCTAHGITGALRYRLIASGKPDVQLSRLQLYFDERAVEGTIKSDAGAEIRDGIKCAAKIGVGHESLWPYKISKFATKPPAKVYKDAVKFKALTYQRVNVQDIKAALATGNVVVIGLTLYESFQSDAVAKTGMVPMPGKKEKVIGGHCLFACGYGNGRITVQNSWGSDWGMDGRCSFDEAYLQSPLLASDYWQISAEGS